MSAVVVTPNYPMRVAVPQQHRELGCIRIRIGRQRAHVTFPESGKPFDTCNPAGKLFQSAVLPADTGALRHFLSVARLRFNFVRAVQAARHLIRLHGALALFQSPARRVADVFQVFLFPPAPTGLVAFSDGHRDSERKFVNVRKGVGEIQNV